MTLSSVVSYPDRGEGGDPRFWGNCSPHLIEDLFDHYQPQLVGDMMVGSGTTRDVAARRGVPGFFTDLHEGFDALVDEPPLMGFDLVFNHPPYYNMVLYGPQVWHDKPHPHDLSLAPDYNTFLKWLAECLYRQYEMLRAGGRLAVLVADVRKRGEFYPLTHDVSYYGIAEAQIVKIQHATRSGRFREQGGYGSAKVIWIEHEVCLISRRPVGFAVPFRVVQQRECDLRKYAGARWQALILAALEDLGGQAPLSEIYAALRDTTRARQAQAQGTDWEAIVRRELQTRQQFAPGPERGVWRLAWYSDPPASRPRFTRRPAAVMPAGRAYAAGF